MGTWGLPPLQIPCLASGSSGVLLTSSHHHTPFSSGLAFTLHSSLYALPPFTTLKLKKKQTNKRDIKSLLPLLLYHLPFWHHPFPAAALFLSSPNSTLMSTKWCSWPAAFSSLLLQIFALRETKTVSLRWNLMKPCDGLLSPEQLQNLSAGQGLRRL